MKTHHATFVLAIVFLTGLIVLWWAGNSGIDPDVSNSVLPPLDKAQVADIKRLEILTPAADEAKSKAKAKGSQPGGRIVLERRGPGHWQMVEPFDAAADPSMAETLARNLKDLRKSPDAGTIHDPPKTFGLEPPVKTVRVFGVDPKAPLATLDVGRSLNDQLYVRREGGAGIEVVDPKMLSMLDRSAAEWRDRALFHLPSFQVGTLTVTGAGRDLKAERGDGHWHLTRPVRVPADDDKVEGVVAELTSIRVAPGDGGFVANDVKGEAGAAYGLDRPTMTIELLPARGEGKPQTLLVGKPAPDKPDLAYARAGDQDDVVLIDIKTFHDLGLDPNALRSQKVADLTPARVEFVQVKAFDRTFDLARTATGWQLVGPPQELTDTTVVLSLLNLLAEAQTSEFLDPSKVTRPGLDPPWMTIRVWQAGPLAKPAVGLGAPPKTAPSLALQIGQYDALRKSYYARIEGDRTILALPETFGEGLPRNALAFRDRRVLTISPTAFHRLTIRRAGTTIELVAPVESGQSTHWRMLAPVKAATDEEAITRLVMILGNLRAEQYVTDRLDDPRPYGLDAPALTVTWTTPAEAKAPQERTKAKAKVKNQGQAGMETRTLRVGSKVPKSEQWYANIEGSPIVFTLEAEVLEVFESEFHTHRVLAFGPGEVRRLVLRWPDRSLTLKPQERREGKDILWVPEEPGASAPGFDLSRIDALVKSMASLTTPRFLQYRGPIPAATGLDAPRLAIEAELGGDRGTRRLRLGESSAERTLATTAAGSDGPVFLLTGAAWHDLIQSAPKRVELPEDPFVPAGGKPPAEGSLPSPP